MFYFHFLYILVSLFLYFKVVGIMRQNMDKVLDRDAKLSDLDNRAGKKTKLLLKDEHDKIRDWYQC